MSTKLQMLTLFGLFLIAFSLKSIDHLSYEKKTNQYQNLRAKLHSINSRTKYPIATIEVPYNNQIYYCNFYMTILSNFMLNKENLNSNSFLISGEMKIKTDRKTFNETLLFMSITKINDEPVKETQNYGDCDLDLK